MKKISKVIALFVIFAVLALVTTAVTYAMVYGVIWFISSLYGLPDRCSWVPSAGTGIVFLIGLATALRNQIPDITRIKWDSGTTENCPSTVSMHRKGGRLWNMNPLGPQSITSIASIGGAILCYGPSLAIVGILTIIEELRN
jgi:hypothetical protein